MKKMLILLGAATALTFYASAPSIAQGVQIGVPGAGIHIGDPNRPRYREYDRSRFREREVRYGQGCRTITIQRDDGSMRRIRRCD